MASTKEDTKGKEEKPVVVPKTAAEKQRYKIEKLMKKVDKPIVIPEKAGEKLPRVFNPSEFIRNIWGSSAGAGSGDFHVYRGVRRRENARQKFINEKSKQDDLDIEFDKRVELNAKASEERTAKKRAKRQKQKNKMKAKRPKTTTGKEAADNSDGSASDSAEGDE